MITLVNQVFVPILDWTALVRVLLSNKQPLVHSRFTAASTRAYSDG